MSASLRTGRISYEAFRGRYGMPDRNGRNVRFRFVDPRMVADLEADGIAVFCVIENPASIQIWRERIAVAAARCDRDGHEGDCACRQEAAGDAHAPDRTVLIAQPVLPRP